MSQGIKAKFHKSIADKHSALEDTIASALLDIENSSTDLKTELKELQIAKAQEVELTLKGKKERRVVVVYIPFPNGKIVQKSHKKIVPELEKRLKAPVLLVLKRTILSKWIKANRSQKRPRSRTLTAVYDAILDDLVMPTAIIGKRIRYRLDGSRVMKVFLDIADKDIIEDKLDAITALYKKLTTRDIVFEFREDKPFYTIKK
jgi:small subunit ribosomal protein S7e